MKDFFVRVFRRYPILAILILFLVHCQSSQAALEISPQLIELPKNLYAGQLITNEVLIKNTSPWPVQLLESSADCGCTVANLKPVTLSRDQVEKFQVIFNSTGKNGFQDHLVTLLTDRGPHHIKVVGKVSKPMRLFPGALNIRLAPVKEIHTNILVRFSANYPLPRLSDLLLETNSEAIKAQLVKARGADAAFEVEVILDAEKAALNRFTTMTLTLTDRRTGMKEIVPVDLNLLIPFQVQPNIVNLGMVDGNTTNSTSIQLTRRSTTPFHITLGQTSHPWIKASLDTLGEGKWQLNVQLMTGPRESAELPAYVELMTDFPQLPRWRVPVAYALIQTNAICCGELINNQRTYD